MLSQNGNDMTGFIDIVYANVLDIEPPPPETHLNTSNAVTMCPT